MIKAVLFDVDGTLLNTEDFFLQAWVAAGAEQGYTIGREALLRTRGVSIKVAVDVFRELVDPAFPYHDVRNRRTVLAEEAICNADPEVLRKKGTLTVLPALREMGLSLAVASSTDINATQVHLKRAGLWQFIDEAVGGDMVSNGKPEPDIFLMAAQKLGVAPEECVVVGDTPADVFGGTAAGMRVVLIPDLVAPTEQTRSLSAAVLENIEQLPQTLEAMIREEK